MGTRNTYFGQSDKYSGMTAKIDNSTVMNPVVYHSTPHSKKECKAMLKVLEQFEPEPRWLSVGQRNKILSLFFAGHADDDIPSMLHVPQSAVDIVINNRFLYPKLENFIKED